MDGRIHRPGELERRGLEMEGILVPITFFAMIAAIVILPRYFRSQERQKMAEAMRAAIEHGQPLPTDIMDAVSTNVRAPDIMATPQRDLRTGIIWLGVGIGFAALGAALSFEEPDSLLPLLGVAAFPVFIGLAFVILSVINKRKA
jgi:hypothetical protein